MTVDLADIRAWRFFAAAPREFLAQYADDFIIKNAHCAERFLAESLAFLADNPVSTLTAAGRFTRGMLECARRMAREVDVGFSALELPAERLFTLVRRTSGELLLKSNCADGGQGWPAVLAKAGMPAGERSPAIYWSEAFRRIVIEDAVPELRIRDRAVFFGFMKALSGFTARGLNWAALALRSGISAPCARDWTRFLASIGLIDLIEPLSAPAPRRAKMRPKLYWTAPGLALWLSDSMRDPSPQLTAALSENAVYLALKTAQPHAGFVHFLDTNAVCAPFVSQLQTPAGLVRHAFFVVTDERGAARAFSHLRSLAKIGLVESAAHMVRMPEAPADGIVLEEITANPFAATKENKQ